MLNSSLRDTLESKSSHLVKQKQNMYSLSLAIGNMKMGKVLRCETKR